jgi:hypothetical protein
MLTVRARRLVVLLAALTAVALTGCASVRTTPGPTGAGAQNRVWAFTPAAQLLTPQTSSQSSCSRPGFTVSAVGLASGFCVATEDGGGSVFWSGSSEARAAAEQFATENGGQTLEMTARGQELEAANLDWPEAQPQWDAASADFASGATGDVHVFQAAEGVRLGSTWARVEYPILNQNPDVNLIFHTVGGG